MKLINPRGEIVEFTDEKGKKILSMKVKIRQGWKKFVEKTVKKEDSEKDTPNKRGRKPKVNGKSNNKK